MPRAAAARADTAPAHAPSRRHGAPARRRTPAQPSRRAPARKGPAPKTARRTATPVDARRRAALALGRFVEARTQGLLDQLLRGRLWVGFVGALLAGIVFLNVSLLQLNQEIARTTTHATALDRQNSTLRARVAALDSSERIQRLATARGMLMPDPGQYRYLRSRPWLDDQLAARRTTAPHPPIPASATLAGSPPPATTAPTTPAAAPTTPTPATTPPAATTPTAPTAAVTTP
jgi:cell division protein FtsL